MCVFECTKIALAKKSTTTKITITILLDAPIDIGARAKFASNVISKVRSARSEMRARAPISSLALSSST
jgi:hypothetical protein